MVMVFVVVLQDNDEVIVNIYKEEAKKSEPDARRHVTE